MRVCQFSSSTVNTHYFSNLGRGLSAKGLDLLFVTMAEKEAPEWVHATTGVRYFCLDVTSRKQYALGVWRLARFLQREQVDVLQTHLFDAGLVGVIAASLARTPLVVLTRHHLDQVRLVGTRFHTALDRWMARKADHVVVLSQAVRNYMISQDDIPGDNIEVIYQGFDFENLSATDADRQRVRTEFNFTTEFVIGCIGHLYKTKGHLYLLKALSELINEIPHARLLLLGEGDKSAIEKTITEFGLEGRVVFAGYRNDVPACIRAMDLVVHPSLSEAFCQVLIEAMGVGTPLVTTNVGGAAEVVTSSETGILIPPADAPAIAAAILELYRNTELRERIALAGRESVRKRFTIERMIERQLNCYHRCLHQKSEGGEYRVTTQI